MPFLKPLMQRLRAKGFRTHLETNGILWKALDEVLEETDCVAMDMKPASVTGESNFDADHEKFLRIAQKKEVFVKIILSTALRREEFEAEIDIVARVNPEVPVLLVPISGEREGHEDPALMQLLGELQRWAQSRLREVRIVPRFHKILNIR